GDLGTRVEDVLTSDWIPAVTNGYSEPAWNALGGDPSLSCCFSGWGGRPLHNVPNAPGGSIDAFETRLVSLGCGVVDGDGGWRAGWTRAYAQNKSYHDWSFYTLCPQFHDSEPNGYVDYGTGTVYPGYRRHVT